MVDLLSRPFQARPSAGNVAQSRSKRAFDACAAAFGLLLLAPFLLAVAVLIRLDSPGRVLFSQRRYGRDGKTFRIYKFRTMTATASRDSFAQAVVGDARITRLGKILRKTSIDELPQLLNVLKGDMALVGPRPHPLDLDDHFSGLIPDYMRRYAARPGITGLAQISGHRGPTPTVEAMAERVKYDLAYIDGWSFRSDLNILQRTVFHVMDLRHER